MKGIHFIALFLFVFQLLAQRQANIDFKNASVVIIPDPMEKTLQGNVTYEFDVLKNVDSIFLNAVNMEFISIEIPDEAFEYRYDQKILTINKEFEKGGSYSMMISYKVQPKQTVYFMGWDDTIEGNEQIWTQGQGKYTSHWLPSFDDMTEKVIFDIGFSINEAFHVVSNGNLILRKQDAKENKNWAFDMKEPISSYLAAFVIGDFDKKVIRSKSGIPIELYYEPQDSLKVEPTYRYTKQIFDFLEAEIGVAYPWQNYKQVPVHDFLYAGMENTTCTIFSNQYMIDSTAFVDKNYVNVNAHELAHQWFGNLVTEVSAEHHWLHEGFATYYAYLAEQHLFGDEHFYWKLFDTGNTLFERSKRGEGQALTDPKANSLTFYEKGAWALVMLRDMIGDTVFQKGIQSYLNTYRFSNATISDFLTEMQLASKQDLSMYRKVWLESNTFPWKEALRYVTAKAGSIQQFNELQSQTTDSTSLDESNLMRLWGKQMPMAFKRNVIFNYGAQISDSSLIKILANESDEVRQAIAMAVPTITPGLKVAFESMLKDPTYLTQETLLFKLWEAYPEERHRYLDELALVEGLPNKNVRLLWLTLALVTPDYQPKKKQQFYTELNNYTSTYYHFEIRQTAFQYLNQIQALSDASLKSLLQATEHHVWQFKKSSRNLLKALVNNDVVKARLLSLKDSLNEKERESLQKLVNL